MRAFPALVAALLLAPVASAAPLRVHDVTFTPSPVRETQDVVATVRVTNVGDVTVCPCVAAWVGWAAGDAPVEMGALAPGESVVLASPPLRPGPDEDVGFTLQVTEAGAPYAQLDDGAWHRAPIVRDGSAALSPLELVLEPVRPRVGDDVRVMVRAQNVGNVALRDVTAHLTGPGMAASGGDPWLARGEEVHALATWRATAGVATLRGEVHSPRLGILAVEQRVEPVPRERGAPPGPAPDLIALRGTSECPCGHYLFTDYTIVVRNDGDAMANASTLAATGQNVPVPALAPGAETEVTLQVRTSARASTLRVALDVFDDVWEKDEANNDVSVPLQRLTPGPGGALALLVAAAAARVTRRRTWGRAT